MPFLLLFRSSTLLIISFCSTKIGLVNNRKHGGFIFLNLVQGLCLYWMLDELVLEIELQHVSLLCSNIHMHILRLYFF